MLENRNYFLFSPLAINHGGHHSFSHGDTPSSPRAAGIGPHDLRHGKVGEEIPTNLSLFWIVVLNEILLDSKVSKSPLGVSG
jgi:hypothetical protein